MRNSLFYPIFLLSLVTAFSQNKDGILTARIVADSLPQENVNIKNLSNDHTATSDKQGIFSIQAFTGDILVLSAVNLETRRRTLSNSDFSGSLLIRMATKTTKLEEVTIEKNVTAEELGIIPSGQKKYTPAESRLYTARSGILDPLLNQISGRTAMLKKEVIAERNLALLNRMDGWFDQKYYRETLHLPEEYVGGFRYYAIGDPDFSRALTDRNKSLGKFLINRLALEYQKTIPHQPSEK